MLTRGQAASDDSLVTRDEAARRLGVSPSSLKRLVKSGDLPAVQLGPRLVRIDPAEITALIQRQKER